MSFLNPYFLAGLAGIAAPIIIHLLTRDQVKRVAFSTLRFFAKGAKLVVRRKKFQEILLIALRALIVAVLALIFARPFIKPKVIVAGDTVGTARVIVMDVSDAVRRANLGDALRKEAGSAAEGLTDGADAAALITFADSPNVQSPLGRDIGQIKTDIAQVQPGYGGENIAEALRKANELLGGSHAKKKEIVLVSELRRQGWHYFKGDWKLASDVTLSVKPLKPAGPLNPIAIVEASAPNSLVLDRQPASIAVRIQNYSDQIRKDQDVTLLINGQKADAQRVNIRPNGSAAVRFRHIFDTPGDHPGSILLGATAADAGDNVFYFNARVLPRIPVLLINGRPSADPREDAAFFIAKALAPAENSPFDVKTVGETQVTAQDVAAASVVVLANTGPLPGPVADALPGLLNRGGGLFFLPGDQAKAETFNAQFASVAPCKLRQILEVRPGNEDTAGSLTHIDFTGPIFDVFSLPHHGDLTLPKFAKYWETTDTQLSHVLARFGDGRPAILEREIGKGVSVALVSAIDPHWNDFALQSVFLPFVHQVGRYLAVQTGKQTGFASGDLLPLPTGCALKDPQGKTHPSTETANAGQPGFYYAMTGDGKADFCYAVNGSFTGSDPAVIAPDEIVAAVERAPGEALDTLAANSISAGSSQQRDGHIWWYLLCGLLGLVLTETVVGNKTPRH
jgi:hypothetical protein